MVNRELIEGKYLEMKQRGVSEDYLDKEAFGQLKLFINEEPECYLLSIKIEEDILFVGG
ncbi:MAG TPA: hypothetical protein PKO30_03100 [Prolixibacteraceae bacterium]|nr:hypothetical protein [Prolixibacteraceae bacterium]